MLVRSLLREAMLATNQRTFSFASQPKLPWLLCVSTIFEAAVARAVLGCTRGILRLYPLTYLFSGTRPPC
jgi:hypothetical protein